MWFAEVNLLMISKPNEFSLNMHRIKMGGKLWIHDINHYHKIVVVLKDTIRLMADIDELIPGWPIE